MSERARRTELARKALDKKDAIDEPRHRDLLEMLRQATQKQDVSAEHATAARAHTADTQCPAWTSARSGAATSRRTTRPRSRRVPCLLGHHYLLRSPQQPELQLRARLRWRGAVRRQRTGARRRQRRRAPRARAAQARDAAAQAPRARRTAAALPPSRAHFTHR